MCNCSITDGINVAAPALFPVPSFYQLHIYTGVRVCARRVSVCDMRMAEHRSRRRICCCCYNDDDDDGDAMMMFGFRDVCSVCTNTRVLYINVYYI